MRVLLPVLQKNFEGSSRLTKIHMGTQIEDIAFFVGSGIIGGLVFVEWLSSALRLVLLSLLFVFGR